jgi:hypothetical protein
MRLLSHHSYRKTYKSSWHLLGISALLWRKGYQSQTHRVLTIWLAGDAMMVGESSHFSSLNLGNVYRA